jgi:hypothetical protein
VGPLLAATVAKPLSRHVRTSCRAGDAGFGLDLAAYLVLSTGGEAHRLCSPPGRRSPTRPRRSLLFIAVLPRLPLAVSRAKPLQWGETAPGLVAALATPLVIDERSEHVVEAEPLFPLLPPMTIAKTAGDRAAIAIQRFARPLVSSTLDRAIDPDRPAGCEARAAALATCHLSSVHDAFARYCVDPTRVCVDMFLARSPCKRPTLPPPKNISVSMHDRHRPSRGSPSFYSPPASCSFAR